MARFDQYKVLWKHKARPKQKTLDLRAENLKTVLRLLNKSHNVSPATTDYMYVHLIKGDGKVVEIFAHDEHSPMTGTFSSVQIAADQEQILNIKKIIEKNRGKHNKPRIKLTNPPIVVLSDAPIVSSACGLYEAQSAGG